MFEVGQVLEFCQNKNIIGIVLDNKRTGSLIKTFIIRLHYTNGMRFSVSLTIDYRWKSIETNKDMSIKYLALLNILQNGFFDIPRNKIFNRKNIDDVGVLNIIFEYIIRDNSYKNLNDLLRIKDDLLFSYLQNIGKTIYGYNLYY